MKYVFVFIALLHFTWSSAQEDSLDMDLEMIQKTIHHQKITLSSQELLHLHFTFSDDEVRKLKNDCLQNPNHCYDTIRKMIKSLSPQ